MTDVTRKYYYSFCLLLSLGVLLWACTKRPMGTFLLKGRLLSVTDSLPVSDHSVTVMSKMLKPGLSGKKIFKEVGATTSDTNGFFEVTCDYYPQEDYYFEEDNFPAHAYLDIDPERKGDTVDIGDLYIN